MSAPEIIRVGEAALSVWRDAPAWNGRRTAALGAFEGASTDAFADLLAESARRLAAEGFEALVGPMDGDTWASYRLVVESDGRPPFLMEPPERPDLAAALARAGWAEIARYGSAEGPLPEAGPVPEPPPGVTLRAFDPDQAEAELNGMHRVSVEAFARAFLYRPIEPKRFLAMYRPVVAHIDPELVVMAEDTEGRLRGYLFAVPDLADPSPERAVIVKTYASLQPGLGSAMMRRFVARAAAAGFRRVIHALMHADNLSAKHSAALGAAVFRRYALWGRTL